MTAVTAMQQAIHADVITYIRTEKDRIDEARKSLDMDIIDPRKLQAAGIPATITQRLCNYEDLDALEDLLDQRLNDLRRDATKMLRIAFADEFFTTP